MLMLTVILLVIVADNIEAACSIPARKLAGAAIAAASNNRLMVRPPVAVSATTEPGPPGPFWAASASTASSGRVGVCTGVGTEPPWGGFAAPIAGNGTMTNPSPSEPKKPSEGSSGFMLNKDFIAQSLVLNSVQAWLRRVILAARGFPG